MIDKLGAVNGEKGNRMLAMVFADENRSQRSLREVDRFGTVNRLVAANAYRRLAQVYHPDEVTGLAPEFQALAEKRMKEINAAYEVLKSDI